MTSAKNIMHIKLPFQISAKMTVVTFSDIWCTWLSSLAQGQVLSTSLFTNLKIALSSLPRTVITHFLHYFSHIFITVYTHVWQKLLAAY